ncbi:hypothetical protein, conserved [Babesia bigemina]|uniref:C3H1-type domain-containing protein n=1 Tax=Babesia bigemina TaxID=5866 RepID=A0A061BKW7_BABBI|nr:hypothetical protein, conserved [Babesia bigemina]CDR71570.1 hypothetical protein, conserved [Babesia bigemina]|eukprot:XP_012770516.1 hypothetical protein, conserved [Babesia bigemina]
MGFLSGVLSNIKGHLGQHKNEINDAIEALKTNKHGGKKGFNVAIGKVVAGVRGYNDAVMKSNKKVSDVLTKMQKDADKYSAERLEKLLPPRNADDPVKIVNLIVAADQTVEECLKEADKFNNALDMKNNAEELRNAIRDLNPNLSTKIENVRENIKHEREGLNKLAGHEKNDLQSMEAKIKTKLHDVKCKVNEHIKKKVKQLVERLKEKVREIRAKLVDIEDKLAQYVKELESWMKEAKKVIDTLLTTVDKIKKEVDGDAATKNLPQLQAAIKKIGEELGHRVGDLDTWKGKAEGVLSEAITKTTEVHDDLEPKENKRDARDKTQIGKALDGITSANTQIGVIKKSLQDEVANLDKWKTEAGDIIGKAERKCKKILADVDTNGSTIREKAKLLQDLAGKLLTAYSSAYTKIKRLPGELKSMLSKLEEVYQHKLKDVHNKVISAIGEETAPGKATGILDVLNRLDEHVKNDLVSLRGRIKNEVIDAYVKMMKEIQITSNNGAGTITLNVPRRDGEGKPQGQTPVTLSVAVAGRIADGLNGNNSPIAKWLNQAASGLQNSIIPDFKYKYLWTDKNPLDNVDALVKILRTGLKNHENKSIIDAIGDSLNEELQQLIKDKESIHLKTATESPDNALMPEYKASTTRTPTEGELRAAIKDIKSHVQYMKRDSPTDVDVESFQGYNSAHTSLNIQSEKGARGDITQKIAEVDNALSDFKAGDHVDQHGHGAVSETKKKITSAFRVIENELEWLTKLVSDESGGDAYSNNDNKGVKVYLGQLQKGLESEQIPYAFAKGLKIIHDSLHRLQGETLPPQISAIQVAVESITSVITKLRSTLSGQVTTKLEALRTHGLNDGDAPWTADGQPTKGLMTIKAEIEKIKSTNVPGVETKLKDLCTAIRSICRDAKEYLEGMKNGRIDVELKKIRDDIHKLRTNNLDNAIKQTDTFLTQFADKAGEQIVKDLEQDANIEVTQAETDIIHELRKRYIAFIKLLLADFSTKCKSELNGLPAAITADADKGAKGFMKQFEDKFIKDDKCIEGIKKIEATSPAQKQSPLTQAAGKLNHAVRRFFNYYHKQADFASDFTKLKPTKDALHTLLDGIRESQRFDYQFRQNLDSFNDVIGKLAPQQFGVSSTSMLQSLKEGFTALVTALDKAYISTYDSETFGGEMFERQKLTPYGAKFAKICLTVVCTLKATLTDLTHNCKSLRGQQINKSTDVGRSFVAHGYAVSDATLQNGELQNKPTVAGENVAKRLLLAISGATDNAHLRWCESNKQRKDNHFHVFDAIDCIFSHFEQYNELCHLLTASSRQHPCSVYDILIWLSGFPYTAVYATMRDITISDLFDNPHKKAAGDDELELTSTDMAAQSITAHPRNISYNYVRKAVEHICATSYDVLTAVVGTGDSRTVYASDFCNNSFNFHYPSDPSDCMDMLLDLLRRLLPVFRFLELQCNIKPEHHGWSQCRYGRDIPTTKSQCNEHSNEEPNGQPKCQVNCQPTSPLMLYLSDSLPGHLPHQLQSVGCRAKCSTCSKSAPGQPCLLPLGFKGFSGSTKTGRQLRDAIKIFIGTGLISSLMCLLPKPPSTLPEHFQFVFTLVGAFNANRDVNSNAVHAAFVKAIRKQSIDLYAEPSELTGALQKAYNSNKQHDGTEHPKASDADLSTLSKAKTCNYPNKDVHCAPYLSTLHSDAYHYAAEKHAGLYLSWAVYLPWSFWQCLESLFRAFTNISCQDWACRRCTHGTACKRGKHGAAYNCQCKGLVECRGVISTLYSFGFTFGNPATLSAAEGKRYCHNFHRQLHNVLNSNYFRTLFEKCDEFIFTIRGPFLWMTVALWSLSLFYLVCVMVGRLDVLHIRSHLRIPSSHKITAQSLLAAAQVGRLAKISYLQP